MLEDRYILLLSTASAAAPDLMATSNSKSNIRSDFRE